MTSYKDETFNVTSRNIDDIKHRLSVIALCERFSCSWISQDRVRTVFSHADRVKCLHVAQLRQQHPPSLQNQNRLGAAKRRKHLFIKNQIFFGLLIKLCKKLNQKSECGSHSTNLTDENNTFQTGLNRSRLGHHVGFLLLCLCVFNQQNIITSQLQSRKSCFHSSWSGPVQSGSVQSCLWNL